MPSSHPRTPPAVRDLLSQAMRAHRDGRLDDAASGYSKILTLEPGNAEALHLLGLIAHRRGRHEEALALMDRALAVDADHAPAWANRGLALRALGDLDGAALSFRRALALRPGLPEALLNLARVEAARGERGAALAAAEAAAAAPATVREARPLLAGLLSEAGRWSEAARTLEAAALDRPEGQRADPRLWLWGGHAWREAGDPARAADAWRRALALPGCPPEAASALGGLLLRAGRAEEATRWLAVAVGSGSADQPTWIAFADAVSLLAAPGPALAAPLQAALARDDLDHQRLERAVRAVLGALPSVSALLASVADAEIPPTELLDAALPDLLAHPLFAPWLRQTLVAHPGWERVLRALRHRLVAQEIAGGHPPLPVLEALAIQAWNTEYASAPADRAQIAALTRELAAPELARSSALAAFANLTPLERLPGARCLLRPGWETGPLAALLRQQLAEPAEEEAIEPGIPTLARTDDPTSAAVRAQYEQSPYPRLLHVHRRTPTSLTTLLGHLFPHFRRAPQPEGRLQVLVAGCGTGQHALTTATRLADADVLAVDLSRRSLARATRAARAWGLDHLRFAEADLLALGQLGPRFHVVESVGVIHHLADPAAGLAALVDRLLPGGMIQLGLYSALGRRDVEAARALLAPTELDASPDGIRAARALLARLPEDHPARPVIWSPDFTSLSGCRDLLFHVCEHRFSARQIQDLLAEHGLVFVGFQHARPEVATLFQERFPEDPDQTDLGRWDALEHEHPRIFSGMYVFWCWKPT